MEQTKWTTASRLELNKHWVLNQVVCQGTVDFDQSSVIPERRIFYWEGTCRLKINKQRIRENKSSFFFFVPTQDINKVYCQNGILKTLRQVFEQYFEPDVCVYINEPVKITNFHFSASFGFDFNLCISDIIPELNEKFGKVSVKGYQEESCPTSDISLDQLKRCSDLGNTNFLMQVFVHITDDRFSAKTSAPRRHVFKFMRAKNVTEKVKTRVTLITSFITEDLLDIFKCIQSFDKK